MCPYNAHRQTLTNCVQTLFKIVEAHYELGTFITSELYNQLANSVADPELELRGGTGGEGGWFWFTFPAGVSLLCHFFFYLKWGGGVIYSYWMRIHNKVFTVKLTMCFTVKFIPSFWSSNLNNNYEATSGILNELWKLFVNSLEMQIVNLSSPLNTASWWERDLAARWFQTSCNSFYCLTLLHPFCRKPSSPHWCQLKSFLRTLICRKRTLWNRSCWRLDSYP